MTTARSFLLVIWVAERGLRFYPCVLETLSQPILLYARVSLPFVDIIVAVVVDAAAPVTAVSTPAPTSTPPAAAAVVHFYAAYK